MATTFKSVTLLLLLTLVSGIASADVATDNNAEVKDAGADSEQHDLDAQETGWLAYPVQEKMRELEYLKSKIFSPFSALKSPPNGIYYNYPSSGVAYYPSYGGGGSYFPSFPSYNKYNKFQSTFSPKLWYGKSYSGGFYPKSKPTYAPDCHYGSYTPPSSYTPSRPIYSTGTPLQYYYTNVSPPKNYGTYFTSSKKPFPKPIYGPPTTSFAVLSPPGIEPNSGWSSIVPAAPSSRPTWSGVPSAFPSSPASSPPIPSFPATSSPPYWSSVTSSFPASPPTYPNTPSPPYWSSFTSSYPTSVPASPVSSTSPPPWSSVTSSFPTSPPAIPNTPSPPYWSSYTPSFPTSPPALPVSSTPSPPVSSFPTSRPSLPVSSPSSPPWSSLPSSPSTPAPNAFQYYILPPSPAAPTTPDSNTPSEEVVITPAPPTVKGNFGYVTSVPSAKIAVPVGGPAYPLPDPPGSTYAVSYYPNVFFISNEQHSERSSSPLTSPEVPSTPPANSNISETTPSSENPNTTETPENSPNPLVPPQPVFSTFYSSNTIDQTRIPLVYSYQQPVLQPTGGFFYPPNAYTIPTGYQITDSSLGAPAQGYLGSISKTLLPSVKAGPAPFGYNYAAPSVSWQAALAKTPEC